MFGNILVIVGIHPSGHQKLLVPSIHTLWLNITIGGKEENCTFECCVKFWLEWSSISNCGWFRHYMLFDATIVIRVHINPDLLHHQLFNEL